MFTTSLLMSAFVLGGWGGGSCEPVGSSAAPLTTHHSPAYEWRSHPGDPGRSYLFLHGVQVAGYDHERNIYRTYDAVTDSWGPPTKPPWDTSFSRPPQAGASPKPGASSKHHASVTNFGVETEKLNGHAESYRVNGRHATRADAVRALSVPDDADRLRLTIIGTEADRQKLLADWDKAPEFADCKDRFLVQSYSSDDWAVAQSGFVTSGHPTIYVQLPNGQVLHRQDDYKGAGDLAQALRRADPHYDPKKDPDRRRWSLWPGFDLAKIPPAGWVLLAGFLLLLLHRGRS